MVSVVTLDIVGSRQLDDRVSAQSALDAAVARVENDFSLATRAFVPTVGDEQQAVYPTLDAALAGLLLLQLALPDVVQCRFGIGVGDIGVVPSRSGDIPEGPGWWAAREAIETVHSLEQRQVPGARTWVAAADSSLEVQSQIRRTNAYLLARDQLVGAMSERARRLTYGRCRGLTQGELAATESITQSAVSQALAVSGASAIVEGFRLLVPVTK